MNKTYISYIKLVSAIAIWASLYHIAKHLLSHGADILVVVFLRYFISAIVLIGILKIKTGKIIHNVSPKVMMLLFFSGCIGVSIYNISFFYAESLVSGNIVAIMFSFAPCITVLLSIIFLNLKPNTISITGMIAALVGTIGVINFATPSCGKFFCLSTFSNWDLGVALSLFAAFCFAVNSIIVRVVSEQKISGLIINTYSAIFGVIITGIIQLIIHKPIDLGLYTNSEFSLTILYVSIMATVVAYLWFTDSLIKLGVLKTVIFQNTLPLQTILIGALFFHDTISLNVLRCSLLVIAGVIMTNVGNSAIGATFMKQLKRKKKS
ncbi:MAG: DMT family transporter [Burkholderiales bacterium]|nr:DMT family transporter [Burkholderiales bacterium]